MTMALFSGSIDKLTGAGVILSGAAADDMDVEVFVLLMGAHAFIKGNENNRDSMSEQPHLKEEFFKSLERLKVSTWLDFFKMAKDIGAGKGIHVANMEAFSRRIRKHHQIIKRLGRLFQIRLKNTFFPPFLLPLRLNLSGLITHSQILTQPENKKQIRGFTEFFVLC